MNNVCQNYELLDFGDGRRLERFGKVTLDRPCPAAERFERSNVNAWPDANARFEGRWDEKGGWTVRRELPERWNLTLGSLCFELKRTDFGHLGLFPEQAENWRWIGEQCGPAAFPKTDQSACRVGRVEQAPPQQSSGDGGARFTRPTLQPLTVLNLFAYTGGSTLAAAAAGAEVVHVDAAINVVAWARRNAELSGLADAPIRWIAEDAIKFVKREVKRGNRYDAVILDPPSYGHGPRGEVWRLSKHLPRLLAMLAELTSGRPAFLLLTCHTPGYDAEVLSRMLQEQYTCMSGGSLQGRQLSIKSADGRELPSGVVVRWSRK